MDRIIRGAGGTVTITLYDASGAPADAGAGNATVVVKDGGGATIGGMTTGVHGGTGVYNLAVPTSLAVLDRYDVAWTFPDSSTAATQFELVGGRIFTVAELRAYDARLATATVPAIEAQRQYVEERFEKITGKAFNLHGRRLLLDGNNSRRINTGQVGLTKLVSAGILPPSNGTAIPLTGSQIAATTVDPDGWLERTDGGWWTGGSNNIALLVEHGYTTPPEPIWQAALMYARSRMLNRALETERASAVVTDIGGYRLTIAGRDGPTGIPDVDAILAEEAGVLGVVGFA